MVIYSHLDTQEKEHNLCLILEPLFYDFMGRYFIDDVR